MLCRVSERRGLRGGVREQERRGGRELCGGDCGGEAGDGGRLGWSESE